MVTNEYVAGSGCVYFVGCDEIALVKIGKTTLGQLKGRIQQLQTGSPALLRLMGVFPSHNPHQEGILHSRFSPYHVRGEWFRVSQEIKDFVKNECLADWSPEAANHQNISTMLTPEQFRARRLLAGHKQESLARALRCTTKTIRNYEKGKVKRLYSVRWEDVRRELKLDQIIG